MEEENGECDFIFKFTLKLPIAILELCFNKYLIEKEKYYEYNNFKS